MAQSYTRRINLYINGKEVRNDIASIRKEYYKSVNALKRMEIGSKEYNEQVAKSKKLKSILQKHNQQLRDTSRSWFSLRKAADKFNRYFALVGSAIAGLTGTVLGLKQTISKFAEFDDKLADVMKTTGLTKEEVKKLNEELKKLDTRTAQLELLDLARVAGKLGITGAEDVLGFVRAADQISVALGEDLGGAADAVRELGKLTDIFDLKALFGQEDALLKVGSAINELGMASTANEEYLVNFSKRTAGIAPQAGVSIQNILGLGATLDALGQRAEMSSTAYSKLMTTMTKKTDEFARIAGMSIEDFTQLVTADANEAMIRVFEGIQKTDGGFQQMVGILGDLGVEGQRMTSVFGALANNTEMLREQQDLANKAFAEGTSLTDEFNIKNNTAQAQLEKARKKLYNLSVELGERLMPAMTVSTNSLSYLIKALMRGPKWIKENQILLISLAGALLAYNGRLIESILLQGKDLLIKGKNLALDKLQVVTINAKAIATRLMVATTGKATFAQKRLIVTQRSLNAAMNANPVGLIIAAFTALVIAIKAYDKYSKQAREREEERKKALDELNQANKNYNDLQTDIGEQMKTLNRMSRERKETLQDEIDKTIELTEAELLLQKAKQEEIKQQNTEATLWQKMVALNRYGLLQLGKIKERINQKAKENGLAAATEMEDGIDSLEQKLKTLKGQGVNLDEILNAESIGDDIGMDTITAMEEKLSMYQTALKNYVVNSEEYIRVQQKIADTEKALREARNAGDTGGAGSDFDNTQKALETAYKQEENLLKEKLYNKEITEQQYRDEQYALELAHLTAMRELYRQHDEELMEIEGKIIDKKLAWQTEFNKMLEVSKTITEKITEDEKKMFADIDAEMDAYMDNYYDKLDESTDKELAAEEQKRKAREAAKEAQIEAAVQAGAAAVENAETAEEAGKAILNTIRQQIKAYMAEAVATQVLKALKTVPFPFNVAAATIAGGAATFLFNKIIPEFAAGGFTNGARLYVAGEKGTEWIAPNWMVENPSTAGVIATLDKMREQRTIVNPVIPKYATGGYTSGSTSTPPPAPATDPALMNLLMEVTEIMKQVKNTKENPPALAIDRFEKERERYLRIKQTSGL